ncbi:DUF4301 family protein [Flavobacterium humi]|uniref:DUF4301 family protein n=1 Tax=Flavobacterium humi TaxID=2562683 RepID=A0A4Z0L9Z8_9FLAO|nr:DUF4301 family protein [Flavobacterium humi]TGD58442.1 DUF4301 family protein [Flavobacterium humi]
MEESITTKSGLAKTYGFTEADFEQIHAEGIPLEKISNELFIFQSGISKIVLEKPAIINDGIFSLSETETLYFAEIFERKKEKFQLEKFVPASGAASRMFQFLSEFLKEFKPDSESINAYINRTQNSLLSVFLIGMDKFPFFKSIDKRLNEKYADFQSWEKDKKNYFFIKTLLDADEFDFCNKPKGILPFHNYSGQILTPIEEHLKEAVHYSASNGVAKIHFTISSEHQAAFEGIIRETQSDFEKKSGFSIHPSFSKQHSSTNTIAVNSGNNPLRNDSGQLILRPGGHGALINNLNQSLSDIVFIKNIDNVSHNDIDAISLYKKVLGGYLITLQKKVFDNLKQLNNPDIKKEDILKIQHFIENDLHIKTTANFAEYKKESRIKHLKSLLDKPIRVCGMVKNENEPGGGPFWIREKNGNISLQIVESSQIDLQNERQWHIFKSATHFNPVDIVCGLKNHKGEKFNLQDFVDPDSGFIVEKSKNGTQYKAYELPGLWNGAMANWITIFIEVPLVTFNPVKTVNDLLKPNHQPQ